MVIKFDVPRHICTLAKLRVCVEHVLYSDPERLEEPDYGVTTDTNIYYVWIDISDTDDVSEQEIKEKITDALYS